MQIILDTIQNDCTEDRKIEGILVAMQQKNSKKVIYYNVMNLSHKIKGKRLLRSNKISK